MKGVSFQNGNVEIVCETSEGATSNDDGNNNIIVVENVPKHCTKFISRGDGNWVLCQLPSLEYLLVRVDDGKRITLPKHMRIPIYGHGRGSELILSPSNNLMFCSTHVPASSNYKSYVLDISNLENIQLIFVDYECGKVHFDDKDRFIVTKTVEEFEYDGFVTNDEDDIKTLLISKGIYTTSDFIDDRQLWKAGVKLREKRTVTVREVCRSKVTTDTPEKWEWKNWREFDEMRIVEKKVHYI